jgi:hypothetical protein
VSLSECECECVRECVRLCCDARVARVADAWVPKPVVGKARCIGCASAELVPTHMLTAPTLLLVLVLLRCCCRYCRCCCCCCCATINSPVFSMKDADTIFVASNVTKVRFRLAQSFTHPLADWSTC